MKTLDQIKKEYAIEHGYGCINQMCALSHGYDFINHSDEISRRHAKEVAKQALYNASLIVKPYGFIRYNDCHSIRNKITNESNVPNL